MTTPVYIPSPESLGGGKYPDLSLYPVLMPHRERLLLYALVASLAPRRVLEIGTAFGGSALIMADALMGVREDWTIVSIDPEPQVSPDDRAHLASIGVRLITGASPYVLASASTLTNGDGFDLALVDAEHDEVSVFRDLIGITDYCRSFGELHILVHDAHSADVMTGCLKAMRVWEKSSIGVQAHGVLPRTPWMVSGMPMGGFLYLTLSDTPAFPTYFPNPSPL